MTITRALFAVWLFGLSFSAAPARAQEIKVTLLGTGTPIPTVERFGPSTLIEAGGQKLLIDCGRGVPMRLWQLGIPLSAVTTVFLTHLHSDHTVGIPDLWLTGWLPPPFGRRASPFHIIGPSGTKDLMAGLERAFAWDIRTRIPDENLSPQGIAVIADEIREGVVYNKGGVKVTAFNVDHGPLIHPALGYRIDYGGHSVVISGDTRPTENLIRFSQGADVLIHEVALAPPGQTVRSDAARRIIGHHTTPEEVGRIFSRLKPKLAVYSHIALLTTESTVAAPTIDDLVQATRRSYNGPLEVGEDLMTITIAQTVSVRRFTAPNPR